jgi:hypothetical protein
VSATATLVSTSRSGRFLALVAIAKPADEIVADRRSGSGNHQQIAALDQRFGRGRLDVQAGTVDEDLDDLVMQGGTLRETFRDEASRVCSGCPCRATVGVAGAPRRRPSAADASQ